MHYVNRRSQRTQKYKFSVMCPDMLFMETATGPPEHEKLFVIVSCPGHTRMHYVTHRSHRMLKYKFSVTCPDMLFVESTSVPPEHEK
jgi:hypothetical protein